MRERRLTTRLARTSGAMVLVSCALAMLALQPGFGGGGVARAARLERNFTCHMGGASTESAPGEILRTKDVVAGARRETPLMNVRRPARQTHILGTLAIVQRLILSAAQASGQGGHGWGMLWVEPACVEVLPPMPRESTRSGARREADGGMPMERAFAIGHQLLAPPGV